MSRNLGNFTTISCIFSQFFAAHAQKRPDPVKFLTPNLKSLWAVSYSNFGGASAKIYTCFERKTAFIMQNFQNFGAGGGEMTIFD